MAFIRLPSWGSWMTGWLNGWKNLSFYVPRGRPISRVYDCMEETGSSHTLFCFILMTHMGSHSPLSQPFCHITVDLLSYYQSFCSRLPLSLLSYDSGSTLFWLDRQIKFGRVEQNDWEIRDIQLEGWKKLDGTEVYRDFQPGLTSSANPVPRIVWTTGSMCIPSRPVLPSRLKYESNTTGWLKKLGRAAQLLTLHQHIANNQYGMANQI